MASPYDDPLERLKQRKLQPAPTGVTANPAGGKVSAAGGLANVGRSVQQSAANFSGVGAGPKAGVKQGVPMPGRPVPAHVVQQPAQVQNRMFRGQAPRPMIQQMAQAPLPVDTNAGIAPASGGGIKQAMGGNSFGLNDSIGSMRDVTQIGNQRVMNIPGYQSSNPVSGMSVLGGAVPQGQGGAGSVQTRIDSRTPREWLDLVAEQGRTILGGAPDNTGYGGGAGSVGDQIKHNTDTAAQAYRDGSWVGNIVGTSRPMDQDGIMDSIGRGGTGGGGGGDGPDWSDPKSVIEWLTSMGLGAAKGAIGPSADFAKKLNDATKPELLDYFDQFGDLNNVKASGDRFMDPEFYKQYDDLQREQLRSDVDRNRDALMRNALSRQAGGGRGMGGDFAGQVMDASNKAITEGNRGIAMDSLQRQLSGAQAGAQMKTQAQGMIYDLMNQGRTDPREILSFIAETAPEILGSAMELIGAMKPF